MGIIRWESWKNYVQFTENKVSKNIGISYKAWDRLSKESFMLLYYAYIHTYVNYANLAWSSTIRKSTVAKACYSHYLS